MGGPDGRPGLRQGHDPGSERASLSLCFQRASRLSWEAGKPRDGNDRMSGCCGLLRIISSSFTGYPVYADVES